MAVMKIIFTVILVGVAYIGDHVVFNSKYSSSQAFRAVADSFVHASIGCLSALLFFQSLYNITGHNIVMNVMICTVISALIDIDHVFVARSFYLKDLFGLRQRGIFHCTTFCLFITSLLFLYSYRTKNNTFYLHTFMIIIAYMSHHLRDGNRRGLWLFPFGHTPALKSYVYIVMLAVLPNVLPYVYSTYKNVFSRNYVIEYI